MNKNPNMDSIFTETMFLMFSNLIDMKPLYRASPETKDAEDDLVGYIGQQIPDKAKAVDLLDKAEQVVYYNMSDAFTAGFQIGLQLTKLIEDTRNNQRNKTLERLLKAANDLNCEEGENVNV